MRHVRHGLIKGQGTVLMQFLIQLADSALAFGWQLGCCDGFIPT
jgi:hypothetical protein